MSISSESSFIPDIGQMREHIVICDGTIEPSPDETLELIQRRSPILVTKAQIAQSRDGKQQDYRRDHNQDVPDTYICFRSDPRVAISVRDMVFWAERKTHFQSDVWLRVVGIREHIARHRFIVLSCQLIAQYSAQIAARGFDQPQPIRGQEPLY